MKKSWILHLAIYRILKKRVCVCQLSFGSVQSIWCCFHALHAVYCAIVRKFKFSGCLIFEAQRRQVPKLRAISIPRAMHTLEVCCRWTELKPRNQTVPEPILLHFCISLILLCCWQAYPTFLHLFIMLSHNCFQSPRSFHLLFRIFSLKISCSEVRKFTYSLKKR